MMNLASEVVIRLQGRTFCTAESCTGGGIGAAVTAVAGASAVFKGGIISYCNEIKEELLAVPEFVLSEYGAVSAETAQAMAKGARRALKTDIAVSVTGLAGPSGDDFGNPVGTVHIGYADDKICISKQYLFQGNRDQIRQQSIEAALRMVLEYA